MSSSEGSCLITEREGAKKAIDSLLINCQLQRRCVGRRSSLFQGLELLACSCYDRRLHANGNSGSKQDSHDSEKSLTTALACTCLQPAAAAACERHSPVSWDREWEREREERAGEQVMTGVSCLLLLPSVNTVTRQQRTRAPSGALTRVRSEAATQLPTDRQSLLASDQEQSLSLIPLSLCSLHLPLSPPKLLVNPLTLHPWSSRPESTL